MSVASAKLELPDPSDPELAPYWEGCRAGELRIPRCRACRRWVWYPRGHCPGCGGDDIEWTRVSGRGKLYTWVTVRRSFVPWMDGKVPYVAGLVELDEDPAIRIAAVLDVAPGETLRLEQPVEVFFDDVGGLTLPQFRLRRNMGS